MTTIPLDSFSAYQDQGIDYIHPSQAGCNLQHALAITFVALTALALIGAIILNIAHGCDMGPLSQFAFSTGLAETCTLLAASGLLFILSVVVLVCQTNQVTQPETTPASAPPVLPEVDLQPIIHPYPEVQSDFVIRIKNHCTQQTVDFPCPKTIKVHEGISELKKLCGVDDFVLIFCSQKLLDSRNPSVSVDLESNFMDWLATHEFENNNRMHLVPPEYDLSSAGLQQL